MIQSNKTSITSEKNGQLFMGKKFNWIFPIKHWNKNPIEYLEFQNFIWIQIYVKMITYPF